MHSPFNDSGVHTHKCIFWNSEAVMTGLLFQMQPVRNWYQPQ